MTRPIRVLSFGAGVQSSCILLRSILGDLPKLDAVIFADTGDEPNYVYNWLITAKSICETNNIKFYIVKKSHSLSGHLIARIPRDIRIDPIPAYSDSNGKPVPIKRGCTREYKIVLIDACVIRNILGIMPFDKHPKTLKVETWIGISRDEVKRMKVSVDPWRRFWHPLIQEQYPDDHKYNKTGCYWLNERWDRQRCIEFLNKQVSGILIGRSACVFCPFRSNSEWGFLLRNDMNGFNKACYIDDILRSGKDGLIHAMKNKCYIHSSLTPLKERPFLKDKDDDTSYFDDECSGYCGV